MDKVNLSNIVAFKINSSTTLYPEEIEVVEEIVYLMVSKFLKADTGTFILDGQKETKNASCILRFNLTDGTYSEDREAFLTRAKDLVSESIDEVLQFVDRTAPTDIYPNRTDVLVLNCEYGRFICSLYMNFSRDIDTQAMLLLLAVAKTLANLCEEDSVLQRSWEILKEGFEFLPFEGYETLIDSLFEKCELPALKQWKKWSEQEECPIFFD